MLHSLAGDIFLVLFIIRIVKKFNYKILTIKLDFCNLLFMKYLNLHNTIKAKKTDNTGSSEFTFYQLYTLQILFISQIRFLRIHFNNSSKIVTLYIFGH